MIDHADQAPVFDKLKRTEATRAARPIINGWLLPNKAYAMNVFPKVNPVPFIISIVHAMAGGYGAAGLKAPVQRKVVLITDAAPNQLFQATSIAYMTSPSSVWMATIMKNMKIISWDELQGLDDTNAFPNTILDLVIFHTTSPEQLDRASMTQNGLRRLNAAFLIVGEYKTNKESQRLSDGDYESILHLKDIESILEDHPSHYPSDEYQRYSSIGLHWKAINDGADIPCPRLLHLVRKADGVFKWDVEKLG